MNGPIVTPRSTISRRSAMIPIGNVTVPPETISRITVQGTILSRTILEGSWREKSGRLVQAAHGAVHGSRDNRRV